MPRCVRTAALILAAAAPGLALSAIVPASQVRSVEANAIAVVAGGTPVIESDQASAIGYAPFAAQVQPKATATSAASGSFAIAEGVASQTSSIGGNAVAAQGQASLSLTLPSSGAGATAVADGDSLFELVFMVDVLSSFTLSGNVDTQAIVTGGASLPSLGNVVMLEDLDLSSILFETLTDDEAFSVSGWLNPGTTYRLRASAAIDANQASSNTQDRTVTGFSSFDIDLQLVPQGVPEPATLWLVAGGTGLLWVGRRRRPSGAFRS